MANKTKFPPAFFRVYAILSKGDYPAIYYLDAKSKNLAMYYLVKSYELGYERARLELLSINPHKKYKSARSYLMAYDD